MDSKNQSLEIVDTLKRLNERLDTMTNIKSEEMKAIEKAQKLFADKVNEIKNLRFKKHS